MPSSLPMQAGLYVDDVPTFFLRLILHWKRLAYPTMLSNAAGAISAISMPLQ
ncbi:hypothetical protein DAEQUDRAFT_129396 [Daedalea quercina L-15889]|uniref:Uncharacterized protein n=1 Tax=Daedalea quercina L-15889 TaxID=1314783 RepID=A0A165S165_9APHY|nr:hypothetical protein DAEQUDRAFT_129396 [Daedalea quercina L-15889]